VIARKFVVAAWLSALFVALTVAVYWAHVRYFRVDVVLYSAMLDVVLGTSAMALVLFAMRRLALYDAFEKMLLLLVWLLGGCLAAVLVPTVIDRSLSFYILEKLEQRGGGIQLARFDEVFTQEYVREHRLVDVRLTEQVASGTVEIRGGCVRLTERGERAAHFSRFFRAHFLPRHRLLGSDYSDDLVDPFRHSAPRNDYLCR
jgi:hypothetical protein